uniref:Zinc finger protein 839 n=1 Tax=Catharus ustulatus TaxID=91951 RepID=A0A8C3U0T1_CATUS
MAAPGAGGAGALPPPPPAEGELPGTRGAPPGAAAAGREEGGGGGSGAELLAVTEELVQSLAALEAGAGAASGTVLYLRADGSAAEGAGLSAGEQRRLLEKLLEGPGPPPPPRPAAAALAPAELRRVIEQVSKAQEQPKPAGTAAPPPQPCPAGGIMQNAARQLQSVAQQVALQQGRAAAATRLLPQKLEAICVQVQPGQMKETEGPMTSLAPIQSKTITLSQPVGRNSSIPGLGIINPQIIRIQPVSGAEQQQLFLHSSSESPVQLLMQRPLPSHGSVSVDKIPPSKVVNGQRAACATASASRSPNPTVAAASSASTPCLEKKQKDDKLKKSLKVKTRSGRISRPPKYKAKDYKFIKMEDLADGHQSDSDDYSELSIEDDEEGKVKGKDALFSSSNYNLKPKTFKCQTCEKSYIGKGGLARHYKLNPGHGQLESSPQKIPLNKPNGSIFVEEEIMNPAYLDSTAVTLNHEKAPATSLEETVDLKAGEQVKFSLHLFLKLPQHTAYLSRKSSDILCSENGVHNVWALIQQCDNEDLMELALPRLTKLVTVYEFLLMKVEKGHPAKAYFPDVYREFEDLHNMVKKMAYDHLSNSDSVNCQQPVEIKDAKVIKHSVWNYDWFVCLFVCFILDALAVFKSLPLRKTFSVNPVSKYHQFAAMMFPQLPFPILSSVTGAAVNPKRTKLEDVTENVNNAYASQDEVKEKSGNLCTLQSTGLPAREENAHSAKYHELQEENSNCAIKERSEQLHNADLTDEMQELEKAFSTNVVPINYPHSAQAESHQNAVHGASLSTHGNQENAFKNQSEYSCGTEEAHELTNTVTVDETVAFEISDESHDFLSQGHEQIFIQTSDGLILSHPDTAVLSQAEGIVIVTDSNGTTMHIRTPEGIPLETVEALLAMEQHCNQKF